MNKIFRSPFISVPFALILTLLLARLALGAEKKDARVTQAVHDVRLLTSQAKARPVSVNETVQEGTAVRTGNDSRAELTFNDQSLARLGANTIFSYESGAHDINLSSGAVLLCVPPKAGTARINTPAVTAAISGGVSMGESHKNSWTKVIVVEGEGIITLKKTGQTIILHSGQMIALPPGAKAFTKIQNIDLKKLIDNSLLIRFARLPAWVWALIDPIIEHQPGGLEDVTGFDAIDQRAATLETPEPRHPSPHPEPSGARRN